MDVSSDRSFDWQELRRERLRLQRIGRRVPYISFVLIHLALALFLIAIFFVDRLALDAYNKVVLNFGLIAGAVLLLASTWAYTILLSRRLKHAVLYWSQMEAACEQQGRLNELKDQFLTHVSHELRTPLTEVYGYLELLDMHDNKHDAATQQDFLDHAKKGCNDLIDLVTTILEAVQVRSALDVSQETCIPVAALAHDVIASYPAQETSQFEIAIEVAEEVSVLASEQSLRQILRNLLSNAFKYCPAGTTITVMAATAEEASRRAATPQVCLCVRDTGPGIPPEEQSLLFQRFVRLQRNLSGPVRGTGLGLFICKQLVEAMSGRIWVESSGRAGEGSRFCILLPDGATVPVATLEAQKRGSP